MRESFHSHRIDRDARQRRARAQAHLHRVRRDRGQQGPALRLPRHPLLVAALAGVLGGILGEPLYAALTGAGARPLEAIAVRGTSRLSPAEVAHATGIEAGTPLWRVDAAAVAEALRGHDWIAGAETLSLPGGTLLVSVVEREPVATVTLQDRLFAVDAEGAPFAPLEASAPELVQLVAEDEVLPGEPSDDLALAVRLAQRLPELGLAAPSAVRVARHGDPEGFSLALATLPARVVLGREDLDARLDDLARLVAARPDAVAQAVSIDLRFADQVVLRSGPTREGSADTAAERGDATPHNRRPTG